MHRTQQQFLQRRTIAAARSHNRRNQVTSTVMLIDSSLGQQSASLTSRDRAGLELSCTFCRHTGFRRASCNELQPKCTRSVQHDCAQHCCHTASCSHLLDNLIWLTCIRASFGGRTLSTLICNTAAACSTASLRAYSGEAGAHSNGHLPEYGPHVSLLDSKAAQNSRDMLLFQVQGTACIDHTSRSVAA